MKTTHLLLAGLMLSGCASTKFVRSAPIQSTVNRPENILVFYAKKDVPFECQEIGRIFVKTTQWTSYNPPRDIERIKVEAAKQGADAVIIQDRSRFESSGGAYSGAYGAVASNRAKDITEFYGIAIVKK